MSITVAGFVKNGVVVPNAPLPEGAQVEIVVSNEPGGSGKRRAPRPSISSSRSPSRPRSARPTLTQRATTFMNAIDHVGREKHGRQDVDGRPVSQRGAAAVQQGNAQLAYVSDMRPLSGRGCDPTESP